MSELDVKTRRAEALTNLIVQADDLGFDRQINLAIEAALSLGRITSTSSIVVAPYFDDACKIIRKWPRASHGLHLTFTCERPEYNWRPAADAKQIASLIFHSTFYRHPKEFVAHAEPSELRIEMESQLSRFVAGTGRPPTHIDIHMYSCCYDPALFGMTLDFSKKLGIPLIVLRDVFNFHNLQRHYKAPDIRYVVSSIRMRGDIRIAASEWRNFYLKQLARIGNGLFVLTLHPGLYGATEVKDSPFGRSWRNRDYEFLKGLDIRAVAERLQIKLTDWNLANNS